MRLRSLPKGLASVSSQGNQSYRSVPKASKLLELPPGTEKPFLRLTGIREVPMSWVALREFSKETF